MKKLEQITTILLILAFMVRITIKDYFFVTSLIFYAFPWIVLCFGSILLFIINYKKRKKRILWLISTFILCFFWIGNSYVKNKSSLNHNHKSEDHEHEHEGHHHDHILEDYEVVFWNAFRKNNVEDAIQEIGNIPDLLVLLEYDENNKKPFSALKKQYPNHHLHLIKERFAVLSKHSIKNIKFHELVDEAVLLEFQTLIQGSYFQVYVTDVSSSVTKFRKPSIEAVFNRIKKEGKTILMGDFNTPYESVHFDAYKEQFEHTFSAKGNGFRETWIWNFPLLSLDHIWTSKDIELESVEKINTWKSDHNFIKFYIHK